MEAIYVKYSDELYHHGVKKQKWGVRRYQNKDGSLTALGKKHVKGEDKGSETAAGAVGGGAAKDDKEKEKKTEGLSDKEVAKYSNDVVKGSYGNWQDRVNNLKKKGLSADDIIKVQGRVNESLGVSGGASKEFQALVRSSFKSSDSKPKTEKKTVKKPEAKKTAVKKTKAPSAKKSNINKMVDGAVRKLKKEAKKELKNKYIKHYADEDFLTHYGVKGMKWRKHKARYGDGVKNSEYYKAISPEARELVDRNIRIGESIERREGPEAFNKWSNGTKVYKPKTRIQKLSEKKNKATKTIKAFGNKTLTSSKKAVSYGKRSIKAISKKTSKTYIKIMRKTGLPREVHRQTGPNSYKTYKIW